VACPQVEQVGSSRWRCNSLALQRWPQSTAVHSSEMHTFYERTIKGIIIIIKKEKE